MRLERLELIAFGPFTDTTLDFSDPGPVLHLVYGPNEAGKSTTRRALTGLLFGIPERTRDAHRHAKKDLRIGGVVTDGTGARLHAVRRKGRKQTLLEPETNDPLDEARLARFLRGVQRERFELSFSLDARQLREGGLALLRGGGDLGMSLFDAGLGGTGVGRVLEELEGGADELWRENAKNPALNQAIVDFKRHDAAARQAALKPRAFEEQVQEIERKERELELLGARRLEREAEKKRLQRLRLVHSPLRALERLEAERDALGELPRGFDATGPVGVALDERLTAIRAGRLERPKLEEARDEAERTARAELERVRPDMAFERVDELRPDPLRRERLRDAVEREQLLQNDRRQCARELAQHAERLTRLREAHSEALEGDVDPERERERTVRLERALQAARTALDEAEGLEERRRRIERGRARCSTEGSTIPGLDVERLASLELPASEAVEALCEEAARHAEEGRGQERDLEQHEAAARELEAERLGEEEGVDLPSEERLADARARRDRSWGRMRGGEDASGELAETFESELREADTLADRLRWDAARVERAAARRVARERLAVEAAALAERSRRLHTQRDDWAERWAEAWSPTGLEPRAPQEMRRLLQRLHQLRQSWRESDEAEEQLAEDEARVRERADALRACLSDSGDTERLADLLDAGEASLRRRVERERRRAEAQRAIDQQRELVARSEEQLAALDAELAAWRGEWEAIARTLGFDEAVRPREAQVVQDELEGLFLALDRSREARARLAALDREREDFSARIRELTQAAESSSEDGSSEDVEALAAELLERLRRASAVAEELDRERQRLESGADGHSREELRAQLEDVDTDALPARIDDIDDELEELQEDIGRLRGDLGSDRAGLELLRDETAAVEASEAAAAALAHVRELAGRYLRRKSAAVLLRREIDRYREEHQAPVLQLAGAHFARLTRGGFERLAASYDEGDEPVLACVRAGGEEVAVDGLSHGTRDQLFLALRLASLEVLAKADEPLPLVCDDLLDAFDDERARAALAQLGELTSTTQVILLTHHERHVELAREALGPKRLRVHRLGREHGVESAKAGHAER